MSRGVVAIGLLIDDLTAWGTILLRLVVDEAEASVSSVKGLDDRQERASALGLSDLDTFDLIQLPSSWIGWLGHISTLRITGSDEEARTHEEQSQGDEFQGFHTKR